MEYKVIFTTGYDDDIDSISKELKCDVLILDEKANYYCPQFITLDRINGVFEKNKTCFLEDNLIIMHTITKDSILNSIPDLIKWKFFLRWIPLTSEQLEKYFYPKEDWVYFSVIID